MKVEKGADNIIVVNPAANQKDEVQLCGNGAEGAWGRVGGAEGGVQLGWRGAVEGGAVEGGVEGGVEGSVEGGVEGGVEGVGGLSLTRSESHLE